MDKDYFIYCWYTLKLDILTSMEFIYMYAIFIICDLCDIFLVYFRTYLCDIYTNWFSWKMIFTNLFFLIKVIYIM